MNDFQYHNYASMKLFPYRLEEKLVMTIGYGLCFIAVVALLPWGDDYPSVQIPSKLIAQHCHSHQYEK